jgi:predicted RecB family nuclease
MHDIDRTLASAVHKSLNSPLPLEMLAGLGPATAIDGIGHETVAKIAAQARLQRDARQSGKHVFELLPIGPGRGFANLPPPDAGDLFFDMEGDPLAGEGLEYLFGIYGRFEGATAASFKPVWGHDPVQEKAAFETTIRLFVGQMRRHPNAHIFHYAAYEPSHLKILAMRHATMEAELDQLLRDAASLTFIVSSSMPCGLRRRAIR